MGDPLRAWLANGQDPEGRLIRLINRLPTTVAVVVSTISVVVVVVVVETIILCRRIRNIRFLPPMYDSYFPP